MKHTLISLLTAILVVTASAAPAPVLAKKEQAAAAPQDAVLWDWWLVWLGGDKPAREAIYVDAISVETIIDHAAIMTTPIDKKMKKFPVDYLQADAMLISEDTQKAAKNLSRIRVRCDAQKIMFDTSYETYWDTDRGVVTKPASPWIDVGNDIRRSQIAKFMCDAKARTDKNMMIRVDQGPDPLDRTWAIFWGDVKKPEFKTTKSKEEVEAKYAATLAKAKKQNADATVYAQSQLEDIEKEDAFMASIRQNFKARGEKFQILFQYMPGWDEAQINTAWGTPIRSDWQGEVRRLIYAYQDIVYDQVQVPVDIIECQEGACSKTGETTKPDLVGRNVYCERTLYLRPGGSKPDPRLVDYAWSCS